MTIPPASTSAVVTTSHGAGPDVREIARSVAESCGLPFLSRRSIPDGTPMLVVEAEGAHVVLGERVVRSHPGMGLVRVRRLRRGDEHDPLVDLGEIAAGDAVLDATFGFGQDALVWAQAVGGEGRVLGLESSPLLAALALAGVRHWPEPGATLMRRVELRCGDFRPALAELPDKSFDVVFFDPMFRRPRMAAPDFEVLRALADVDPLTSEDLAQARRVARRWVLVKDGFPGADLRRLGIPAVRTRRSAEIMFGRIRPNGGDSHLQRPQGEVLRR